MIKNWNLSALILGGILLLSTAVYAETKTSGGFEYQLKPTPSWVEPVALPEPKSIIVQGSQYLLSDEQLSLLNGQYDSYSRVAQKVTSEQGLEQASKISILFNPEFQTFTLHHIKIKRGDRIIDMTQQSKIELFQREEQVNNNIYDGKVTAFIVIPDVRVGDIIEYASTTSGKNPVFGDHNFASFSLGWSVAVQTSFMRLVTDANRPMNFKVHNIEGQPNVTKSADKIEYSWRQDDLVAIINEEDFPMGFTPYPFIEFTEFDTWGGVIDWALTHYQPHQPNDGALTQYVAQLKQQTNSVEEYIEAAIKFVQNDVRYFGIETGQNSHIPSKPDEVFDRRYGDCKDKTMLLNYLLRERGVEANPALVAMQNRGAIADYLPSPGHFDHVITHFKLNDRDYWIDGTRTFQLGKLDSLGVTNFEQALIIKPQNGQLTPLEIREEHRSQINVHETFRATGGYDDPVTLEVDIIFNSHEAEYLRNALAAQTMSEFTKHYVDFYSKHFPGIEVVNDITAQDDTTNNRVKLTSSFLIKDFWYSEGNRVTTPLYGEFLSSYVQLPNTIQRKFPLGLYHPMEVNQQVDVYFPETIEWRFTDNPIVIENDGIKYARTIAHEGPLLSVKHEYKTKQTEIATSDVPTYVRDIKRIRETLYLSVYSGKNASSSLRTVLRNLLNRKIEQSKNSANDNNESSL